MHLNQNTIVTTDYMTIRNIITKLETLQGLQKCNTETGSAQMLMEKRLWQTCSVQDWPTPSICKNVLSAKWNKVKYTKMRCAYAVVAL